MGFQDENEDEQRRETTWEYLRAAAPAADPGRIGKEAN